MAVLDGVILGVGFVSIQRLLELALSRRHERLLRARGAIERGRGHYPLMVALHALWLLSTLIEGLLRGPGLPALWPIPAALFLLVQPLRYWAILSLGDYWNTRILVVPNAKLVARGPYRYLRHPNYVVVTVEVATFPLIFGAWVTALVFSVLNAALLFVRIREENRALAELAGQADSSSASQQNPA
ncbi:MAG TPA: isoprenylcysteine carboxyl methyltransferase family protein [Rubrobacteraceae bacterium]|nr:isoprenylcysteine carboxyl methyltransferase family protein [Rubrobacteraceae bacterium]